LFTNQNSWKTGSKVVLCSALLSVYAGRPANAQGVSGFAQQGQAPNFGVTSVQPIAQSMLAQAQTPNIPVTTGGGTVQPIDLTPIQYPEKNSALSPFNSVRTHILNFFPAKMFIDATVENSLRLETNAFQTRKHQRRDMVYRVLPNVTVGYAPTQTTRISANYFMFNDLYADHGNALSRVVQSVGLRGDKDFHLNNSTVLTTSLMYRELFTTQTGSLRAPSSFNVNHPLNDILPSVSIVHSVAPNWIVYSSIIGQLRWKNIVGGPWQEGDQFYSAGTIYRRGAWYVSQDFTWFDSFGRGSVRFPGGPNNYHQAILTTEVGRRLSHNIPVVAFVRAQPIFNIGQDKRAGFAGPDVRIFGGLRMELAKPALFPLKLHNAS